MLQGVSETIAGESPTSGPSDEHAARASSSDAKGAERVTKPTKMSRRLAIAGAVLLIEYLAISYTFDAYGVGQRGGVWSVLGQVGQLGSLLVVATTAFLLVPSDRRGLTAGAKAARPSIGILALHAVLAGAFVAATYLAFGTTEAPAGPALAWMLGWAMLGAATATSLFVGVLGQWRWLLKTLGRAVAAGGVLGLVAWLAGSLSTELWAPLSRMTFHAVAALLRLMAFELYVDLPNVVLGLEGFAVSVSPACSGFEGIGLFVALMSGFIYRFRATLRFPNVLLLLPVGMVAVWFGNVLRIAALMIVGARVDAQMAIGSFHSKAGWVFFCAITLGIAAVGRSLPFFKRDEVKQTDSDDFENPTAPLLLPVLTWIGVGLITSMFSTGHDPLYGVRVVITGAVLWSFRARYAELWQKPSALAWVVGAAVGVLWLVLPLSGVTNEPVAAPGDESWSSLQYVSWVGFRVVGAVLVIPLCEELAFRGYLTRFLSNREFWLVPYQSLTALGVLGSSLAFGLVHDRWLLASVTGVVYAILLRYSGRLMDAVVAHAASNLVIAIWVLATSNWQHW